MSRFEEGTQEATEVLNEVIDENFHELEGASIKFLFDTKKRKSGGKYISGKLQKTSELTKHLSADNLNPRGHDYILYIDKNIWSEIPRADKKRLIFHYLSYAEIDFEKNEPYKTKNCDFYGFFDELTYNNDDPHWGQRIDQVAESIYEKD